jgi:hypothetical protein
VANEDEHITELANDVIETADVYKRHMVFLDGDDE